MSVPNTVAQLPKGFQFLVKEPQKGEEGGVARTKENCLELAYPMNVLEQKIIVFSSVRHRYYLFDTLKQIEHYMDVAVDRTFNEVIYGHFSQRLKFDIDDIDKTDIFAAVNLIKAAWQRNDGPLPPYNMREGCKVLVFKTSPRGIHVVIDYVVPNAKAAREFFDFVISTIGKDHKLFSKFDGRVYGRIQLFRMLGAQKSTAGLAKISLTTVKPLFGETTIRVYKKE